jgi:hypothetical protein
MPTNWPKGKPWDKFNRGRSMVFKIILKNGLKNKIIII